MVTATAAADGTVTVEVLDFAYDNAGTPYALTRTNGTTSTTYYYITNLQGDVMYLVEANGDTAAEYAYDAYGKITTATGSMAEINPLRYRGYYYDKDTGFYYLQSRYYDSTTCRFINADRYASTGQGILGFNMFAYCNNSPVNSIDPTGHRAMGPAFVYCNDGVQPIPQPIKPYSSYSDGDIYVIDKDDWESVESQVQKQLFDGDVVIIDGRRGSNNPNIQVVNSYKVKYLSQQEEIVDAILGYTNLYPGDSGWSRNRQDMLHEWNYHNWAYALGIGREHSQSVDFDMNDAHKAIIHKAIELWLG